MRPAVCLAALLLLAAAFAVRPASGEPSGAPAVTGDLVVKDGIPVLRLWGTPRERGFAQGWLLAEDIVEGTSRSLEAFFGKRMSLYEGLMIPLARKAFVFTPAEQEEMEGVLAGLEARLPESTARALEVLGRPPRLDDVLLLNVFGDVHALGCSSIALWGPRTADTTPTVARNFDFPALDLVVSRQHVRVVAPREGARGYVGVSYPGCIGVLTAQNEEGVFAAIHDVHVRPGMQDLAQKNVARLVAIRRLMESLPSEGAVEKALELCRSWNTLYGNNVMIATPSRGAGASAGVLEYDTRETDDRGADLRTPPDGIRCVVCTNHHRVRGSGTCDRYDALCGLGLADGGVLTVEAAFALADRAAVPAADETIASGRLGTLHQVVAETGARRFHVRMAGLGANIRGQGILTLDVSAALHGVTGSR